MMRSDLVFLSFRCIQFTSMGVVVLFLAVWPKFDVCCTVGYISGLLVLFCMTGVPSGVCSFTCSVLNTGLYVDGQECGIVKHGVFLRGGGR